MLVDAGPDFFTFDKSFEVNILPFVNEVVKGTRFTSFKGVQFSRSPFEAFLIWFPEFFIYAKLI